MMLKKLSIALFVFFSRVYRAEAQAGTTSVGPLLACDLTTFSCPGVDGCCTIAGCCGSGCCALGYTCINEGTSEEACCPSSDPTKCGTVASPSSSGSGSDSDSHTCTGISNCRDSSTGQTWTCLLGQTCSLSYRGCNPCPYIYDDSSSSSTSSSSFSSPTTSLVESSSPSSPSASVSSTSSSGSCSQEVKPILYWPGAVCVGLAFLL
ncbi:hypothetical protein GGR51DRAFT_488028 [Nemania sp. FL0031]|nr:hypothetical protein GGR51DRAFT_488028 [Nemania sp. FL0031]